ncbi:hypothetical protein GTA62_06270 [Roseobacter sp. HKCCD9010]|uniref:hypothetical protein n=1 Tax=unclassified Roseobacter TaxID=196798 RepID=UPI0014911099|nr:MULTISPECIES: hypothetical protein [unclassified Roseobacter]MBF9048526.1 hypothetical protein [Rhodobacterales bacterium HKCCD4356]NOC47904.1 hypothetical protein [Roseobacter sp. HKCCD7386]NNV10525.1 hypothetical protein [Roseobacter sp. HKCCD7357]NNV14710.1 hypothetical protein [Roseobacter sp. HKCCD8768]NNV24169.1 hypothetical protein [Roseobacter sp. HKCCD8192]
MAKTLYNLRLLGDRPLQQERLDLFLDAYGASLDANPACFSSSRRRGAAALWDDFVRISEDTNRAMSNNAARRIVMKDE